MRLLLTADPELPVPPRLYGGIERIIDLLIIELRHRGHEVALVAHPESTTPVDRHFPWNGAQSQSLRDSMANMRVLHSAVRQFKPQLVHSFSRLAYMLPILPACLPKIMSFQRKPTGRTTKLASQIAGQSLAFTGCSEHIAQQGRAGGGRNWSAIHNMVPLDRFQYRQSVASDAPLVFLGRIERIKGAHTAVIAAIQSGRRLILAGNRADSGPEADYFEDEIEPHLGSNGIEYIGPVDDIRKNELLGSAAAMISPIEWDEPFGIVFIEALACGTPVISCPRGALPEIVREGIDGYLVNSVDAAVAAIQRVAKIHRSDCRARVEDCFSVPVIVNKYEELYRQMLNGGGG